MFARREESISAYGTGLSGCSPVISSEATEDIKNASKTLGHAILTGMGIGLGFFLIKKFGVKW